MGYFIAPMGRVLAEGQDYPEFRSVLKDLETEAFARASRIWPGWQPGGLFPGEKRYGVGPLRKNDMAGDTTDSARSGSYSFVVPSAAVGWQDILRFTVPENHIIAVGGYQFTDDALRFWQLRHEFGDKLFPIIDIQEAQNYDKFDLVIKMDKGSELIAEPHQRVLIRGYRGNTGTQRVVPIGLHLYRNLSDVIVET